MPKLPGFIGPSYTLRTSNYEAQKTLNLFVESDELGTGKEKEPAMLVSVPGQLKLLQMPKSPIRAIHYTAFGHIVCVAGKTVYYLNSPDNGLTWTSPTPIADLTTSTGPVSVADGIPNYYNGIVNSGMISLVVVVDGSNFGVVFEEGTTTAIQLNNGNSYNGASFVTFQDGFFVFTQNIKSPTVFFASDPLNISALDEVTANIGADYISRVISDHDILWFFGGRSCSVWQNTGASGTSNVFQQIPGSYAEGGCSFPHTIAKASGQLLWVNSDDRGYGQVFQGVGYRGARISTHAVELWLQSFPSLVGASAWTYQDLGHTFYVLNVPGATSTWAYDITEKSWSERAFFKDGVFNRDLIENHTMLGSNFNGIHLCGDYSSGNIYTLSNEVYTLNGEPIYRMRTAPHASAAFNRVFFAQTQIDIETGVGLDGLGYPYFTGYDMTAAPIVTPVNGVPMDGSSPTFTFVDANRLPQTPLTSPTPVITSSGTWSNTYSITGDTLTATPIAFNIASTQFGTGTGSLANYTFAGGLASGTTITSADIYASDWRGNNLQSSTPITNMSTDSVNFAGASWVVRGASIAPATWNKYPTTLRNIYRPTANIVTSSSGGSSVTNPTNAYSSTFDTLKTTGTLAHYSSTAATSIYHSYTTFGSGINITATLNLAITTATAANGANSVWYSIDAGVTFLPLWFTNNPGIVYPSLIGYGSELASAVPFQTTLTIPDLSKFQIQIACLGSQGAPLLTSTIDLYDVCLINATSSASTTLQNAPDGSNTGTYLIEDNKYDKHAIATSYSSNLGDTTTVSTYYQLGDSTRSLELVIQDTQVAFTGSIATNQLTVVVAPTSGSLMVGQTLEGEGIPPNTTITAGTSSPYTISWTSPAPAILASRSMIAYKNIAKSHFSPSGVITTDIGTATITGVDTVFMGSVLGNQLTVEQLYSGLLSIGQTITGPSIPGGTTIISGVASPYTLSASLGTITSEIMTVSGGVGIYRCSITGTELTTGIHHAAISLYNTNSGDFDTYTGNGASRIGIWGFQIQKDALTKYIPSTSGISGTDYITSNLSTGTVVFNLPPLSGAVLTWSGVVNGISIYPITLSASFSYEGYPAIYKYLGLNPQVSLSYSDDGGHTFGPERYTSMATVGQYRRRCIWRRNGMSRDRVWRVICKEPVKFTIIGAEFKAKVGEING